MLSFRYTGSPDYSLITFLSLILETKIKIAMKRLLMILMISAVSLGATAQHGYVKGSRIRRPHVVVSVVRPAFYPPYYYGYYNPFYNPYLPVYRYPGETKLEVKIDNIRNDYREKIWSARHDKSLSSAQKRETIHKLKHDRDQAINQMKLGYYKSN